ncbi:MAG TPA: hypothetical protein HPQ00_10035, partial [Magnetococcales bacterium]|nr:hypothetical protein [Magnetococcales bacterium]
MIKHPYKYKAFISYSRENKKFAYDLHDGLPKLKIPKESQELAKIFNKEINRNRLFIDQKAVGGGVDLGEILTKALLESEFLIVLCTPEVAGSEWMDKEIQFFKRNRDPKKIIVCVYSGRPDWNAATEIGGQCFPKALRYQIDEEGEITSHLEKEPAWVDFRKKSGEGRKTAMARIACGLLGVEPKEVVDFQKLRERRIWQTWITFAVGLALVFAGISYFANYQRKLAEENAKIASENQRLAEKNNSLSTAQLGLREASQGRIRSALQKGLQAYKKDQNLVTKTSLWDSLTSLVREEVADFRQPLYGRGLHLIKDGQLIVVAEKKVAVRDKDGRIHWGNHGAGLSLSSALASDSGSLFILGQGQGRLERWDVQSRQSILLHEHGQSCSWMAKARDRDRLVMGCQDGQIFVYDAASDNTLRQVWQSNKRPNESTAEASIGISNDGSMIFWTYGSGIMRGWNIEEDRMAWEGAVQANPAEFQVSHDGKWSVWYSQDGQMGIFNIKNGQPLGYRRVDGAIQALSISPHDDRVALAVKWPPEANRNPGILELDLASGRDTMVYEAPEYFTQVAYSPAGEIYGLIVKGAIYKMIPSQERSFIPTENSVLKLWPGDAVKKGWFTLVCGKQQDSTERVSLGKSARLSAFVAPIPMVDADFQCLVQGSGQLHWFSDDFSRSETVPGSEEATTAAKLSNGQFLVGTRDGQVLLVTPGQSGKSQQLLSKPLGKPIHFISALQDDFIVLSQGLNEQANGIYQLGPLGLSPHFLFQENFNSGRWRSLGEITNSFSLPEVGRVLLVSNLNRHVNENGELIQFDLKSKEIVASLPFKGGMVRDIVYLPKKNRLALATGNGRIALLNPQTWKMETELVNGDVPVTTLLTWEQDGATILLAGDNQGTLTLRNLDDEKEQYRTFPLPGSIISQSYQQETDLLALGSPQGITVWQGLKRPRFLEKSPGYP